MTTLKKQIPISIGFVDPFFTAKGAFFKSQNYMSLFCMHTFGFAKSKIHFVLQVVVFGTQAVMCFHLV